MAIKHHYENPPDKKDRAEKTFKTRICGRCRRPYQPSGPRQEICEPCKRNIKEPPVPIPEIKDDDEIVALEDDLRAVEDTMAEQDAILNPDVTPDSHITLPAKTPYNHMPISQRPMVPPFDEAVRSVITPRIIEALKEADLYENNYWEFEHETPDRIIYRNIFNKTEILFVKLTGRYYKYQGLDRISE